MGFFDAIGRGYKLTIASLRVASKEPWVFVLPVISGVLLLGLLLSFLVPSFFWAAEISDEYAALAILTTYFFGFFLFYFTQAMVIFAAAERFEGRDPTIGQAFSKAMENLGKILLLTVIGAILGLITRALSSRNSQGRGNLIGQILGSIIGISWTIISYFSLPVILNEKLGVLDSFKRSTELVSRAWGEGLAANLSLGMIYLPGVIMAVIGVAIGSIWIILIGAVLFMAGYVISIPTKAIISQALYVYATKGLVPTGFEEEQLKGSFGKK